MNLPFIRTRIISLEKRCYKWYNLIKYEVSYVQQRHVRAWQQAFVHKRIVRVRQKRANEVGAENVFDFSLGNPNVPAPDCVKDALVELANSCETLHGYTSAQGDVAVREAVAKNISRRFGVDVGKDLIYMTCGAAASLCITLRALNEITTNSSYLRRTSPNTKFSSNRQAGKPWLRVMTKRTSPPTFRH